ncbi:hypothetical protein REO40_05525 [Clostridium perfringens]|uniref:hypothetical protein n=1 Tax=Clostridium perfringens TaxID=1502 RepID=UPI0028CF4756|nr:hypothetical protein [Clostridium perfringens]MDT7983976.1 hypothetical protein [Clostridium perfringens]MDT8039492.1 hypothetical protein [Clostridium perfringens]
MKDIFDKLENSIKIPTFFIRRPSGATECITYKFRQDSILADTKEEFTDNEVFINLIVKNDITKKIKELKKFLVENGFRNIKVLETIEQKDLFETVITCNKSIY